MMFTKSISSAAFVLLAISSQALGHALIEPALGVKGTGARSDVQRPSTASPCGSVNVASALAASTPVVATNGAFTVNVQNFNPGTDGATAIKSATVDTTGTGKSFAGAVTITKNGDPNPTADTTVQVSGTLPAGTTCTGGAAGNQCLVSFTTNAGFGNCVLVTSGAGGAAAGGAGAAAAVAVAGGQNSTTTTAAVAAAASTTTTTTTTTKGKGKGKGKKPRCDDTVAGTRKARDIKAREAAGELFPRDGRNWLWAA